MAANTVSLDSVNLSESFKEWHAQEESIDAELNECLSALAAYQSHLDGWQQDLARQRDELQLAREEFERQKSEDQRSSQEASSELAESREKISHLTQQLLDRTEELRVRDQQRAELSTELELARARAKELAADVEEQKRTLQDERTAWSDQLQHMRELLERQAEESSATRRGGQEAVPAATGEAAPPTAPSQAKDEGGQNAVEAGGARRASHSPVLGSIVEQFGKLRQQRALERQTGKTTR